MLPLLAGNDTSHVQCFPAIANVTHKCVPGFIDCGIYFSTKEVFNAIGTRLTAGSVIVFDEYFGYPQWWNHVSSRRSRNSWLART